MAAKTGPCFETKHLLILWSLKRGSSNSPIRTTHVGIHVWPIEIGDLKPSCCGTAFQCFGFPLTPIHGCSWQVNAKQKKRQLGAGKKRQWNETTWNHSRGLSNCFLHSKSSMIWWSWSSFNTLLEGFPVTSYHNPFWKFCTWALLKNTRITNWEIASNSSVLIHTAAALPSPFVCSSLAFFFHLAKTLLSI